MKDILSSLRLVHLGFSWFMAILHILFGEGLKSLINLGVLSLYIYFLLTLNRLKKESILILLFLVSVGWMLIDELPSAYKTLAGGRFILIFAALIPTMIIVRAAAITILPVLKSQELLAALPDESSYVEFQIAGHTFGSIINTGTFTILSGAVPPGSGEKQRQLFAEAALRGMNSSAIWSLFFVAVAVGKSFIDGTNSWFAMVIGEIIALIF